MVFAGRPRFGRRNNQSTASVSLSSPQIDAAVAPTSPGLYEDVLAQLLTEEIPLRVPDPS